jgi:hypothetical protein
MHDDAEKRFQEFLETLTRPRSTAARIKEMYPLIEEARTRGARWPEIADVLGIPRSTLLAAYSRVNRKARKAKPKAKVEPAPTAAANEAQPAPAGAGEVPASDVEQAA